MSDSAADSFRSVPTPAGDAHRSSQSTSGRKSRPVFLVSLYLFSLRISLQQFLVSLYLFSLRISLQQFLVSLYPFSLRISLQQFLK
jgi:hypothetical protein